MDLYPRKKENDTAKTGFSPDEKSILVITCTCHFLTHFFVLVFPAVTIPLVRSLGMPIEDVLKLSFLMYLLYGLAAFPAGLIVDRWQAKKMLVIGAYLMGGGLVLAGLFPGPRNMYLFLGILGLGASIYHPAGLALISRTVGKRGFALGINGAFGNLGIACAPLFTGLITWLTSWQVTFVVLGGVGILSGIVLGFVRVDEALVREGKKVSGNRQDLAKYFLIICFAMVFMGIAYRGNMILLPAYLELKTTFLYEALQSLSFVKTQGTATLAATLLTSLVFLTGIAGQFIGGRLADHMDLRRAYLLVHALSLPFILAMAFTANYLLVVCAGLYALFSLGMQPIENSLIAALTPSRWRSTSYAIKFILNFGIGSSAVYLVGLVKKAYSLETVYVFLAGVTMLLVLSILVLIFVTRRIPSVRN